MVTRCRLCGNLSPKLFFTQGNKGEFKFYRCRNCELVNYDITGGAAKEQSAETYIDPFDLDLMINQAQTRTFNFIKRHVDQTGMALEVGCGNGRLLHMLHEAGWGAFGLEESELLARNIRATLDLNVEVGNFMDFHVADKDAYDLIVLRHVLQHFEYPLSAMQKINELLRTGAYAILEFTNIDALDLKFRRFLEKKKLHKKKYHPGYVPGHINEYNQKSFEFLLARAGFKLVKWQTYSSSTLKNMFFSIFPVGTNAMVVVEKTRTLM